MEAEKAKRPVGVSAIAALLLTLGAEMFGTVMFAMVSDMDYLTSAAGYKMQAFWLLSAAAAFAIAAFGVGLWKGWDWCRYASMTTLVALTGWSAYSCVANPAGTMVAYRGAALLMLSATSFAYLLMPSARSYFHPVVVKTQENVPFRTGQMVHGAA